MLRPNSRSCRTASIRSGIAGGLAGELVGSSSKATFHHKARRYSVGVVPATCRNVAENELVSLKPRASAISVTDRIGSANNILASFSKVSKTRNSQPRQSAPHVLEVRCHP
jgi:hypothetical protein